MESRIMYVFGIRRVWRNQRGNKNP